MIFLAGWQAIRHDALYFRSPQFLESILTDVPESPSWFLRYVASKLFRISLVAKGGGRAQSLTVESVGGVIG